jgi:hypothetical protein
MKRAPVDCLGRFRKIDLSRILERFLLGPPLVDMEDGNNDHFFHLFGVNYTGATHGHTMKPERMKGARKGKKPRKDNALVGSGSHFTFCREITI